MVDARIRISHLTKQYQKVRAVDDLSFSVAPGQITGFLGPNGSGKTTTLRVLLGLAAPTSGTATIGGRRYSELPEPARIVGAVLDGVGAHPRRTGRDHLRVLCTAARLPKERVDEVLDLVGLASAAGRTFREYSLGMRQRLALAQALLGDPEVLVLDEPMNGLDPQGIHWMRDLMRRLVSTGRTVLVSSHVLSEVALVADNVVIVNAGRLVAEGAMDEITKRLPGTTRLRVRATPAAAVADRIRALGGTVIVDGGGLLVEGVDATAVATAAVESNVQLHGITEEHAPLETVFLSLTDAPTENR